MVWCGAWPIGSRMNMTALQKKEYGILVNGTFRANSSIDIGQITIKQLLPSTAYDISCIAFSGNGYMKENPQLIKQVVITKERLFQIKQATFLNDEVTVFIESNVEIPTICFLFNSKGIKIDSKPYDNSKDDFVVFKVPASKLQYSVQCSLFTENHKRIELKRLFSSGCFYQISIRHHSSILHNANGWFVGSFSSSYHYCGVCDPYPVGC